MPAEQRKPPGRIITFYSYKGGTGRSMALANVAWILASSGKRVLAIDWDLEAPGLQRYFRPFLVDKDLTSSKGIIDYVTDFAAAAITPVPEGEKVSKSWYVEQADLTSYIVSLDGGFHGGGSLDFIPAGQQGPTYAARFSSFNWFKFYDRLGGGEFLEAAKRQMRETYDYVLIDSRTGVSDTAGICTIQMPDTLVVCFTYNNQSIDGAAAVARSVVEARAELKHAAVADGDYDREDEYRFRVVPIPMRADYSMNKLEQRRRVARMRFNPLIDSNAVGDLESYWGAVEVPYLAPYAYEELLSTFYDDPSDVKSVLAAMVRITAHLTDQSVTEFRLYASPAERQDVLQEFASTPEDEAAKTAGQATGPQTDAAQETEIEKSRRLAESTVASLDDKEKAAAPRLWTRLVQVPRRRESLPLSRVRAEQDDIPESAQPLIRKFAAVLITDRDKKTNARTVEAASEEFVRAWPRLQEWVDADRDFIIWRQKLQETVDEWRRVRDATSGGSLAAAAGLPLAAPLVDGYLLVGRDLQEAESWMHARPEDLNRREIEFIKRSRTRKQMRFLRTAAAVLAGLVALAGLSFAAFKFYERSSTANELQRKSQLLESLTQEAELLGSDSAENVQLGALLALEAQKLAKSDKISEVLNRKLLMLPRLYVKSSDYNSDVARVAVVTDAYGIRLTTVSALSGPTGATGGYRRLVVRGLPDLKSMTDYQFNDDVNNVALSPDGTYLANVTASTPATTAAGTVSFVPAVGVLSQGRPRQLSPAYTVKVFQTNNVSRTVWANTNAGGVQMAFSPDGKLFACANDEGEAFVVTLATGAAKKLAHPDVLNFRFSLDSRYLATYHSDHHVHVWSCDNPDKPEASLPDSQGVVAAYSPADGGTIAMIEQANVVNLYKVSDGGKPWHSMSFKDAVIRADLTRDCKYVVAAVKDGTVWVWNVGTGDSPRQLPLGGSLYKFAFSPDGSLLATVEQSNVVRLWDVNADFKSSGFIINESQVQMREAAFSQDSKYIATAGTDQSVRVWILGDNDLGEPCSHLTRNLTQAEFTRYLRGEQYHKTCDTLP